MKSDVVRVAIIGTGGMGKYHTRTWQERVPTAEVAGVFDVDARSARAVATQHKVKRIYDTLEQVLDDDRVHALDICTPNMLHRQIVVAALQAGKHCLCEKPLATSPADIEAMIAARDQSGRILATVQNIRFEPRSLALRRAIDAGRLGRVYYARAWWLRRRKAPPTPGFLRRIQSGFGPGVDLGVHVLDLALYLMGSPQPVTVSGTTFREIGCRSSDANEWGYFDPADFEVEDFATGLVRFENGAALSLEVSWMLNMHEKQKTALWLYGTEGGADWPELHFSEVRDGHMVDSQILCDQDSEGHPTEMIAFVEAITQGKPSPVPAEQSLAVARIISALYESAEAGREVRIKR